MTVPEDEDAVEALTPERAHEPLRERVCMNPLSSV